MEEGSKEERAAPKRGRHPILLDAFLIGTFLAVLLAGTSYWYISQPEERQTAICADIGMWVDTAARPLGELVARAVKQLKSQNKE